MNEKKEFLTKSILSAINRCIIVLQNNQTLSSDNNTDIKLTKTRYLQNKSYSPHHKKRTNETQKTVREGSFVISLKRFKYNNIFLL